MTAFGIAVAVTFVAFAAVTGAAVLWTGRLWRARPALAPAYGLLGTALVAHAAWIAFWIAKPVGLTLCAAVGAAAVATLVHGRVWLTLRAWAPLVGFSAGSATATVGFAALGGVNPDPFTAFATRFRPMPVDNLMQHLFADRLWHHLPVLNLVEQWRGSDRPPLESGFMLLVRPLVRLLGSSPDAPGTDAHVLAFAAAASIVAQLLWIPAVHSLCRTVGWSQQVTYATLTFCTVTPFVFFNVVFTWPKLLAASLAIAAIAILIGTLSGPAPRRAPFAAAAALLTLGYLSHGGVIFIAPLVAVLGVLALRRIGLRRSVGVLLLSTASAVPIYLPWQVYGTVTDPFSGRLLKWYLGGRIAPTSDSVMHVIGSAYSSKSPSELVQIRWGNLRFVTDLGLQQRLDFGSSWLIRVREDDFFRTFVGLGLASILIVVLLAHGAVSAIRRRRSGALPATTPDALRERLALLLVLGSLLSIFVWTLVLIIPNYAMIHVGSYAWMLLLLAVPFAWVASRRPGIAWVLIAMTATYAAVAYSRSGEVVYGLLLSGAPQPTVTPLGAAALVLGLVLMAVVVGAVRRSGRKSTAPSEPPAAVPLPVAARSPVRADRPPAPRPRTPSGSRS